MRKRLKNNPSIKRIADEFSNAMLEVHDIDISDMRLLSRNFNASIARFIDVYGEEDASNIIKEAFYGKYNGYYNGKVISDYLFTHGFDWMSREILISSMVGDTSWR